MKENVRELQNVILIAADEVIRICDKYNIPYFISDGTLLGAVRHNGFIPWDDDFDFAMKRSDYEHFCRVCPSEIDPEKFILQTDVLEEHYALSFAKLRLRRTRLEEKFSEGVDISQGIFVDVFPMDNLPDNLFIRKIFMGMSHVIKNLVWVKCGYGVYTHGNRLSYKLCKFAGHFVPLGVLKKMRYSLITRYNTQLTRDCFNSDYPEEIIQNSFFNERSIYKFEGREMYSFRHADLYLTAVYGDYMTIPPEEERCWHNQEFDLGIYGQGE